VTHHDLKCLPQFFALVAQGLKKFELRRDDRNYQPGDTLTLQEWDSTRGGPEESYTGNELDCCIDYVLRAVGGLETGYCILSITPQLLRRE
jgi:Domain of unknown function (DUF3850)